ncbi:MAG: Tol-Pal system beta propeller repeat protein TolB [Alphaproteobacteria bacterium CG_4_9_14_3_um_filter_47_13]|nr:MAG: Tol-Pal system beta propeller repeat protein TolB [Alphaproteobacteria bacterium CG_4_9_14_3_um_filter_47_13]
MFKTVILAVLSFFILMPSAAYAEVKVNVTQGTVEKLPIAISLFHVEPGADAQLAQQMPEVISANLERSGLFELLDRKAFIQDPASIGTQGVRFGEWRAINAQALVTGTVTRSSDGRTRVEFRLWDVFSEQQLAGMAYTTTPQNWRRIAHIISDEIYKRITGEDSYFDSRIVYIAEQGSPLDRKKRLAIMDQDGANHHYLTDGKTLVLTPRFSPNQQMITYLAYYNNKPRVYLYDIDTGQQQVLGDFQGMTFAPRFSPDGKKVIMSMAKDGNTEIYVMDIGSRQINRLTNNAAIDTSPSYAPDGKQVVFESDRGGTQQLYVMDSNGGNARRITFGQGRYGNPVWSPRGDLIAFTRLYQGQFFIGVIRPDGSGERLITSSYHVEGPTWSPNGRVLAYFKEFSTGAKKQGRESRIYTIDLTGYNERVLKTPVDGSDPAWSPLNQ